MSPCSMLQIKKMMRSVSFKDAKKLAEEVLSLSTGEEVEKHAADRLKKLAPEVIS